MICPSKSGSHPGRGGDPTAPSRTPLCTASSSTARSPLLATLEGGKKSAFDPISPLPAAGIRDSAHISPKLPFPWRTVQKSAVNRLELARELFI